MQIDGGAASVPALVETVDSAPGREVSWHRPPHAPVVDHIPDRVYYRPAAIRFGTPARRGLAGWDRQQRRDQRPFAVGGIGGVAGAGGGTPGVRMRRPAWQGRLAPGLLV